MCLTVDLPPGTGGYSVVKLGIDKQSKEKARPGEIKKSWSRGSHDPAARTHDSAQQCSSRV